MIKTMLGGRKGFCPMELGRKTLSRLFFLGFSTCFCIFSINQAGPESLQNKTEIETDELSRMEEELQDKIRSMERLDQVERWTFGELLDLEDRLELTERLIKTLLAKEKSIEKELQKEERSLRQTELKLSAQSEDCRGRLRQIYEHGRIVPYAALFEASPPLDLANRIRCVKRMVTVDQQMLRTTRALRADLEEKRHNLGRTKPEVSWLKKRKAEERTVHQKSLEETKKLLKKIKSEKKLYAQTIRELQEEVATMNRILGRFQPEDGYKGAGGSEKRSWFEGLKGKLPWPVEGRVVSHFGEQRHPRFYTKTENPGIWIQTEPGSQVVAVAEGNVIYASRLRGYGNFLIVQHDQEYYTLYARLSEISVRPGEEVERSQKIGTAGGGRTSVARLHFQIRKGKQSLDPLEWLR